MNNVKCLKDKIYDYTAVPNIAINDLRSGVMSYAEFSVYSILLDIACKVQRGYKFRLSERTLGDVLGLAPNSAGSHLRKLQSLGYVSKEVIGYERTEDGTKKQVYEYTIHTQPLPARKKE